MGRYVGPMCRICRRAGDKLMLKGDRCYTPKCAVEKRAKPPGPHMSRRRRVSDRGLQLREKQKARYSYGLLEAQFRRLFGEAERKGGMTGDNLLVLLERRLDNVVFRLGFADSRNQARQLVRHGHIAVNGRRTDIPSFLVKEADAISWVAPSVKTEYYKRLLETIEAKTIPQWLSLDKGKLTARIVSLPTPADIQTLFEKQDVVEYYSR